MLGFQSTRSARSATRRDHADQRLRNISIHALREERDLFDLVEAAGFGVFQSTRSARSATLCLASIQGANPNFNPRAPRGARRLLWDYYTLADLFQSTRSARSATAHFRQGAPHFVISIHALREERDPRGRRPLWCRSLYFNPRAPRGARPALFLLRGDKTHDFNPRAPRGARLIRSIASGSAVGFQSTRSARSATEIGG